MVKETGCCKPFKPGPWDEKTIKMKDKLFVRDHVRSFLHIPLNMNKVMIRNVEKIGKQKAWPKVRLMLSDEKSLWGSDIYIAVTKDIPDSEMVEMSGTFMTKVFEGEYKEIGTWIKQMENYVMARGKELKHMYFFYTTCPACAKAYGKNYVVLLAKI